MTLEGDIAIAVVSINVTYVLVVTLVEIFSKRVRERNYEIDWAQHYAREHAQLLRAILARRDIPQRVKDFAVDAALLMTIEEEAPKLVAELRGLNPATKRYRPEFTTVLEDRCAKNPFLIEVFRQFLETGVYAMVLRWPENNARDIRLRYRISSENTFDLLGVLVRKLETTDRDALLDKMRSEADQAGDDEDDEVSAFVALTPFTDGPPVQPRSLPVLEKMQ
jgi:hypothetical protein